VRKARRSGTLSCGHWVNVGQLIASRNHEPWVCINCAIARIRAAQRAPP
jgi:hypothetical protein